MPQNIVKQMKTWLVFTGYLGQCIGESPSLESMAEGRSGLCRPHGRLDTVPGPGVLSSVRDKTLFTHPENGKSRWRTYRANPLTR